MLFLFALHGARLFFKSLPLRRIGGDGHNMLESREDHCRLSLLTSIFVLHGPESQVVKDYAKEKIGV